MAKPTVDVHGPGRRVALPGLAQPRRGSWVPPPRGANAEPGPAGALGSAPPWHEHSNPSATVIDLQHLARLHATRRLAPGQGAVRATPEGGPVRGLAWALALAVPIWAALLGLLALLL